MDDQDEETPMPRICAVCALDRDRGQALELVLQEAVNGVRLLPLSTVAQKFDVSPHSLGRHVRGGHGQRPLPVVLTRTDDATVNLSSLIDRLVDVADATRRVRLHAEAQGQQVNALKASDSETRAIAVLLQRLGINDLSTAESLRAGVTLAKAVGQAARQAPGVAEAICRQLRAVGEDEMADDLTKAARG